MRVVEAVVDRTCDTLIALTPGERIFGVLMITMLLALLIVLWRAPWGGRAELIRELGGLFVSLGEMMRRARGGQ